MLTRSPWIGPTFGASAACLAVLACTATDEIPDSTTAGEPGDAAWDSVSLGGGRRHSIVPTDGGAGLASAELGGAAGWVETSAGRDGGAGEATGGVGGAPADHGGAGGEPNVVVPDCPAPIHDTWTVALGEPGNEWERLFGDPYVDSQNGRLVISYDDLVLRTTAFEGSYYIEHLLTLAGGTVFTPYPEVANVTLPSLRRHRDGTGIELGGTQYGEQNSWSTTEPAGFAGVTVPNVSKVRVSTYIKASAKELAVKVTSGDTSYRSGWVNGFTWSETELGVMRLAGENNSVVYGGDAIYVGPIVGCTQLSDSEVDAAYEL